MENKELIIHMVNGDEYHIKESENFNKMLHCDINEVNNRMTSGKFDYAIISNRSGHDITYLSRCAIKKVKQVSIAIKNVSSIDYVEE